MFACRTVVARKECKSQFRRSKAVRLICRSARPSRAKVDGEAETFHLWVFSDAMLATDRAVSAAIPSPGTMMVVGECANPRRNGSAFSVPRTSALAAAAVLDDASHTEQ
jgi:hypothetical protein